MLYIKIAFVSQLIRNLKGNTVRQFTREHPVYLYNNPVVSADNLCRLRKQMEKEGDKALQATNSCRCQQNLSNIMEIESSHSGYNIGKETVSSGNDGVNHDFWSHELAQGIRMEIEGCTGEWEMVLRARSWNARSFNCADKVKRFLKEQATFTLLQETWRPEEKIIQ